jgi:Fe-S-cluster containining protein
MARYDCKKCPGYCCSYPIITVTQRDLERLAQHLGLSEAECEKKHTMARYGRKRIMRRKKDEHYGKICKFFDTDKRRCTIYEGRPAICREYPGKTNCGYYDFLQFERTAQNDPEWVSTTNHD